MLTTETQIWMQYTQEVKELLNAGAVTVLREISGNISEDASRLIVFVLASYLCNLILTRKYWSF